MITAKDLMSMLAKGNFVGMMSCELSCSDTEREEFYEYLAASKNVSFDKLDYPNTTWKISVNANSTTQAYSEVENYIKDNTIINNSSFCIMLTFSQSQSSKKPETTEFLPPHKFKT